MDDHKSIAPNVSVDRDLVRKFVGSLAQRGRVEIPETGDCLVELAIASQFVLLNRLASGEEIIGGRRPATGEEIDRLQFVFDLVARMAWLRFRLDEANLNARDRETNGNARREADELLTAIRTLDAAKQTPDLFKWNHLSIAISDEGIEITKL